MRPAILCDFNPNLQRLGISQWPEADGVRDEITYQLMFFIITTLLKFDKVTDFSGSTNFVIIAILTLLLKAKALGTFNRILQWGEDKPLIKCAIIWICQQLWMHSMVCMLVASKYVAVQL
ncbi:3-oxo-5-alpha-steroid 4-dehydrogenase [Trifolium repens]|nr:3-oxo-5-alpha-steroid 4-dehydrogenase [Trifolium repens]